MHPTRTGDGPVLLVVSDYPGSQEDAEGKPFVGPSGQLLRGLVRRYWTGSVVYDNCVKCAPRRSGGVGTVGDRVVAACRGYLSAVIRDCRPMKVLAFGERAIFSLTGRSVCPLDVRKGYAWMVGSDPANPIPVHMFPNAVVGTRNRFLRTWLEEDIKWALESPPLCLPMWNARALVVRTQEDALEAEGQLAAANWVSYDVETAGELFSGAFCVLCGAMARPGSKDVWVWDRSAFLSMEIHEVLSRFLANPRIGKVGSNFKYDQGSSAEEGMPILGMVGDTRLARKLLESHCGGDLETMAELVGMGGHKAEAQEALKVAMKSVRKVALDRALGQKNLFADRTICGVGDDYPLPQAVVEAIVPGVLPKIYAYGLLPRVVRLRYNALDALVTARLHQVIDERIQREPALGRILQKVVLPAAEAIPHVERWGVAVDPSAMRVFEAYCEQKLVEVKGRLQAYGDFNPGSYADVARVLFKDLGLTPVREIASGYSTDNETLEELERAHPIVPDLIEFRRLVKLKGTYGTGLLKHVQADGRIHPKLLLDGASTGRPSCQSPNLQNIVRDSSSIEGKMVRNCFIASPGWTLISADYSQLELRVGAMLSGDPGMIQIFRDGYDFHQKTAEMISQIAWGIPPEQVTKMHRTSAKTINFGIFYGIGDAGLAAQAGVTPKEAAVVREAVLGRFKVLSAWIRARLAYARKHGVCWTWWEGFPARRRSLHQIADQDREVAGTAERGSWNGPVQGTGADFCTASLAATTQWILEEDMPARLLLPIHDALLLEVRDDYVDEVAWRVHHTMMSWPSKDVPLKVDVETGPAWGSLQKYDQAKLE